MQHPQKRATHRAPTPEGKDHHGPTNSYASHTAHGSGCKYPKSEVLILAKLFAQFDVQGTGEVGARELALAITKSGDTAFRGGGLEVFKVLVKNGEGKLKFSDYLAQFYPLATAWERELMLGWAQSVMRKPPSVAPQASTDVLQNAIKQAGVSQAQMEEYRMMFKLFNKSGTGLLSREELLEYTKKLGMDVAQIAELYDEVDKFHTGVLNFEQFVCMITRVNMR